MDKQYLPFNADSLLFYNKKTLGRAQHKYIWDLCISVERMNNIIQTEWIDDKEMYLAELQRQHVTFGVDGFTNGRYSSGGEERERFQENSQNLSFVHWFWFFFVIFQLIVLIINRAPQYPPKNLGITTHFGNTIKDKCPIYRLLFFNNCTNQINVSYYTLLFLCTHTINYLNWRNYKIGKSDQYNGWVDHVWEAGAVVIRDTFKS